MAQHLKALAGGKDSRLLSMGAQLLLEAAERTNEESGDGTTTCCVIARAILERGKTLTHGLGDGAAVDLNQVRIGIQKAVKQICSALDEQAIKVQNADEVRNIALVSSDNDTDIADVIVRIYERVGMNGAISILDGDGTHRETRVDFVQGLHVDSGFLSPYFADDRQSINFEEGRAVYVAVVDGNVETEADVVPLLEFAKKTMAPVLIFAHDFSTDALSSLVVNRLQLGLKIVAIKAPIFQSTELLEDISAFTGSVLLGDQHSLYHEQQIAKADPVHVVGKVRQASITAKETVLRGFDDDEKSAARIQDRIRLLEHSLEGDSAELIGDFERDLIYERIGKLKGGLCLVKAGGLLEVEIGECRDRLEDALHAVRAALDEGFVVGGGFALVKASLQLDDTKCDNEYQSIGFDIVRFAAQEPASQIMRNQGLQPTSLLQ